MTRPIVCNILQTQFLIASFLLATAQATPPRRDRPILRHKPTVSHVHRNMIHLFIPASWGAAGAMGMAIYYDNRRPYPTTCSPPAIDKWQHCYVGCMIANWLPSGSISASVLAVMKEVRDAIDYGDFSWPDVFATLKGAWYGDGCESCEACCCEMLIQDKLEKRRHIP